MNFLTLSDLFENFKNCFLFDNCYNPRRQILDLNIKTFKKQNSLITTIIFIKLISFK